MRTSPFAADPLWRHYPWLLGLFLSPFLFGSITSEGKAVVAALLGGSFLLLFWRSDRAEPPNSASFWGWLGLIFLILPLIPLPLSVMELIDPQRAKLALEFPVSPQSPPQWILLSLSPARSVERVWELSLLVTCFWLARRAATHPRIPRHFALGIGATLLFLAASDVWFRLDGKRSVFGLWQNSWGTGAGTFSNRNHFANWISLGALFSLGWILRSLEPLRSARPQPLAKESRSLGEAAFLLLAVSFAFVMATLSGSRGGFFAFLTGIIIWLLLLARRSQNRRRWLVIGIGALAALVFVLASGDFLLSRLLQAKVDLFARYPKIGVWQQTLAVFSKFPLFGTGWGTFVTALNVFKTSGGLVTFLHSENDYVECLLETGTFGMVVYGGLLYTLAHSAISFVWSRSVKTGEPELLFGALAALGGFAVQASFDFVFQITANSLLAAALLGFAAGCRDRACAPILRTRSGKWRIFFNSGWALMILMGAATQGIASFYWHRGLHGASAASRAESIARSLQWWPWASHRQIALSRAQVDLISQEPRPRQVALAEVLRQQWNRTLLWDPYDWELRLECVWLDLAFSGNPQRALAEARDVVKLNPLQSQIPLRLARHYANYDPETAWEFLLSGFPYPEKHFYEALSMAWQVRGETAALWRLTPNRVDSLLILREFAVNQKLFPLAAQAYERATNRVDSLPARSGQR